MSVEIACKQNILVTDFHLLKLLLVVFGFGSQTFVCGFSRQNICSLEELGVKQDMLLFEPYNKYIGRPHSLDILYGKTQSVVLGRGLRPWRN